MFTKKYNSPVLKKYAVASLLSLSSMSAMAAPMTSATFTMYDKTGTIVGLADTSVTGNLNSGTWDVASTVTFFGLNWAAHDGVTFGPGTYSFDTACAAGTGGSCAGTADYTGIVVGAGQVGGHILFNWGTTYDIDVVTVWDVTESSVNDTTILKTYSMIDNAGWGYGQAALLGSDPYDLNDTFTGNSMIDGAFVGFNANFDFTVEALDTTPPVISLNGSDPQTVVQGDAYVEAGATCTDATPQQAYTYTPTIDTSAVNTATLGDQFVTYDCKDANLNAATTVTRTVTVVLPDAVTTLLGTAPAVDYECENTAATYTDAGAQCDDPEDGIWTSFDTDAAGDWTSTISGLVVNLDQVGQGAVRTNEAIPGWSGDVVWTCTDSATPVPNTGTATRTVTVVDTLDPVPGTITHDSVSTLETPTGPLYLESNDVALFVKPTLQAVSDACDLTNFPAIVESIDTVTTAIPDGDARVSSTLTYTATDATGNVMSFPLEVQVRRSEPMITLLGDAKMLLDVGAAYVEPGMDIHDEQDGDLTTVTADGSANGVGAGAGLLTYTIDASAVDVNTQGTYQVFYNVTDSNLNVTQLVRTVVVGASYGNFTMMDVAGNTMGGTNDIVMAWLPDQVNAVLNTDELNYANNLNFNLTIASDGPTAFNGYLWTAHHVRVFGPGTYSFDTGCTNAEIEDTGCPAGFAASSGPAITMTVAEGQLGVHILFDWNVTTNIDVVNVWDQNAVWDNHGDTAPKNALYLGCCGAAPDPDTTWELVSTDVNGDLINGSPMVDGAFVGFYANFNNGPASTGASLAPITTTAQDTVIGGGAVNWLVLLGMLPLMGLFRRVSK